MDFNFSEDQTMVRDLARGILEKEVTSDRVKAVEEDADWFDRSLWSTLAEAGLLGLAVDEDHGGMGFGFLEVCLLLGEIGRVVAPLPLLPTVVLGGMPIGQFGTAEQKDEFLAPLVSGDTILTAALVEDGNEGTETPSTTATRNASGYVLEGSKRFVPAAHLASRILVPAATADGIGIFLVDPQAAGVELTRQETTRTEPVFDLTLTSVSVGDGDLLGGKIEPGTEAIEWIYERAVVATCATQVGVSERALRMTADYVTERVQFGVPIGSFQAVQHRSADCYIDIEATRWVTLRAAWKLERGEPAMRDTAVAKFWAAEASHRIANSAQHLHGGIGVDMDYPLHRYFLWSKALELSLGAAMPQLARIGRDMARTGPQELT